MMHVQGRDTRRWLAALALVLLLVLAAHQFLGASGIPALQSRQRELQRLQKAVQSLQEENKGLERSIRSLNDDPRAIERIAREEMKLARPGEVIYTLPSPPQRPSYGPQAPSSAPQAAAPPSPPARKSSP